jgi:hypothetical protein
MSLVSAIADDRGPTLPNGHAIQRRPDLRRQVAGGFISLMTDPSQNPYNCDDKGVSTTAAQVGAQAEVDARREAAPNNIRTEVLALAGLGAGRDASADGSC